MKPGEKENGRPWQSVCVGGGVVRKITIHCIHMLHFQRGDKAIFKRKRRMCVNGETFGSERGLFQRGLTGKDLA